MHCVDYNSGKNVANYVLPKEVMFFVVLVCVFVYLSGGLLTK